MKNKIFLNKLKTVIFYIAIIIFFVGFNFQDSKTGGWVRQFLPTSIGSAQIKDMAFTDSLTGYIVTNKDSSNTAYILKTTNGGFNWNVINTNSNWFINVFPLNRDTIFFTPLFSILKTTDAGVNWININLPNSNVAVGFYALNSDTLWFADNIAPYLGGGLYRTTNGGINWELQFSTMSGVSGYAKSIYMYNRNIGFMGTDHGELLKTTNSGVSWVKVYVSVYSQILDISFKDSLVGFLADYAFRKTTNGGINWQTMTLPNIPGGYLTDNTTNKFSCYGDTIYTAGSAVEYQNPWRFFALIYKSTNGGLTWGYQIPDTTFHIPVLKFVKFINGKTGWCYNPNQGLHTTIGGDTTIIVNVSKINKPIIKNFKLFQNYPNPFNQSSIINYQCSIAGNIILNIYDITGKKVKTLMNKYQKAGSYEVKFDGADLSSGIYFYSLFIDRERIDTKKMLMIK